MKPRVAIAGAGAVSREYYGPALKAREAAGLLNVSGVYDPDPEATKRLCASFLRGKVAPSYEALLKDSPDLVIVASPPSFHPEQSIAAMEAGANVLCEKPLALTSAHAREMVETALRCRRSLGVNMVRRGFASTAIMSAALKQELVGSPIRVRGFDGGRFQWPVSSQRYFSREVSGGGVLADLGPHSLDLLSYWLGPLSFTRMSDDAMGGVEANCVLELSAERVPITMRFSRDWPRPCEIQIQCTRGILIWNLDDPDRVAVGFGGSRLWLSETESAGFDECFARQLDAALAGTPRVSAEQSLASVDLIASAYAARRSIDMPWMEPLDGP